MIQIDSHYVDCRIASPLQIAALIAIVIATYLAFHLLVTCWRGRHKGKMPVCRKCDYDLTGLSGRSDRCPECGADLKKYGMIRTGHHRFAWPQLFIVLILLGVAGWGGYSISRALDWPITTESLATLSSLRVRAFPSSKKTQVDSVALDEIYRRMANHQLSDEQVRSTYDAALSASQYLVSSFFIQPSRFLTQGVIASVNEGDFTDIMGDIWGFAWDNYRTALQDDELNAYMEMTYSTGAAKAQTVERLEPTRGGKLQWRSTSLFITGVQGPLARLSWNDGVPFTIGALAVSGTLDGQPIDLSHTPFAGSYFYGGSRFPFGVPFGMVDGFPAGTHKLHLVIQYRGAFQRQSTLGWFTPEDVASFDHTLLYPSDKSLRDTDLAHAPAPTGVHKWTRTLDLTLTVNQKNKAEREIIFDSTPLSPSPPALSGPPSGADRLDFHH